MRAQTAARVCACKQMLSASSLVQSCPFLPVPISPESRQRASPRPSPFYPPKKSFVRGKSRSPANHSSLLGAFSEARRHLVERQWEGLPVSDRRPCVVSMRPAAPNVCAANGFSAAAEPWPYDAVNRGAQKGERTRAKEAAEGLWLLAAPLVRGCKACQPANFS